MTGVPANVIVDTVDAVFRRSPYTRAADRSLLAEAVARLGHLISDMMRAASHVPGGVTVVRWTVYVVAALVLGRLVYGGVRYYRATRRGVWASVRRRDPEQEWAIAESYARHGDYTAAAHALYAGFVSALVSRGIVRTHPSNTIGDYVRAIRRASARGVMSPSDQEAHHDARREPVDTGVLLRTFTEFTRAYEVVVYRDGICDATQYATLRTLVDPVARPQMTAA